MDLEHKASYKNKIGDRPFLREEVDQVGGASYSLVQTLLM